MNIVFTKDVVRRISEEQKYTANNVEKVLRLLDILDDLNSFEMTKNKLALKGGTAINLVIFEKLPRLSVDLDFNFAYNIEKEEMIDIRNIINDFLISYFEDKKYTINNRNSFALDSIILSYDSLSGNKDKIKLDINYHNRCHILEPFEKTIQSPFSLIDKKVKVKTLAPIELFAGKIKAFYERCKARDIYDIYTIANSGIINNKESKDFLRKSIIFYSCIGGLKKTQIFNPDIEKLIDLPFRDIKAQLLPVLHTKSGKYPKDIINKTVISFLTDLMKTESNEIDFWDNFENGNFNPELLFNENIAIKLKKHPVALYTLEKNKGASNKKYSFSEIVITQNDKNMLIRCKIDNFQLMSKQLSLIDGQKYEELKQFGTENEINSFKEELAMKYFKEQLECKTSHSLKR